MKIKNVYLSVVRKTGVKTRFNSWRVHKLEKMMNSGRKVVGDKKKSCLRIRSGNVGMTKKSYPNTRACTPATTFSWLIRKPTGGRFLHAARKLNSNYFVASVSRGARNPYAPRAIQIDFFSPRSFLPSVSLALFRVDPRRSRICATSANPERNRIWYRFHVRRNCLHKWKWRRKKLIKGLRAQRVILSFHCLNLDRRLISYGDDDHFSRLCRRLLFLLNEWDSIQLFNLFNYCIYFWKFTKKIEHYNFYLIYKNRDNKIKQTAN